MRFAKKLVFGLAVMSFILGSPSFSYAAKPPKIISGAIDEPIVSSDGYDIQVAHVIIRVPGKLNAVKEVTVTMSTPDVVGSDVGTFSWGPLGGFKEVTTVGSGEEYVNLLMPDINNPDTTSQMIFDSANKQLELIFRWTLNDVYGSTFDNDMNVHLRTIGAVAGNFLFLQSALADSELDVDSSFDTNTPPEVVPVEDLEVIAEIEDVDVDIVATDVDADPITAYILIEGPQDGILTDSNFFWDPSLGDIGDQSVQVVVTDPYGQTTVDFDVSVIEEPTAESGSWTATNASGAPEGRTGHSVVWAGSESIVWGGANLDGTTLSTGARYDTSTGTWIATGTPLNSYATRDHIAVWTGESMIVWGGQTATGETNEGQIYNPATDSWTSMSTVGAPSARVGAVGVWTGSEFIVWGGASDAGFFNDGGRYDPVTDTWVSLSAGSLAPRQGAGAVFSNGEVIVWGGSSWSAETGNVYYSDGESYDPSTDNWLPLNNTGAPEGRIHHAITASVEDNVFIVWGGQGANGYLDTGGVYDLSSGTWSEMAAAGAPEARTFMAHGGSEDGMLIVWGGVDVNNIPLSTGGIYNQQTGTWLATSSIGEPSARQLGEGVWTDSGLFVWGGISAGATFENTGGVFTP